MDQLARKAFRFRAVALGFAIAVFCAHVLVLVHQFDFDAHASDQACEICLIGSGLGAADLANMGAAPAIAPVLLAAGEPQAGPALQVSGYYRARAPPFVS